MKYLLKFNLFLALLFFLVLCLNCETVSATCYRLCYKNQCYYSNDPINYNLDKLTDLKKCQLNSNNSNSCFDDITRDDVDDINCSGTSGNNNYSNDSLVSCGNGLLTDIPVKVPQTVHLIYLLIQVAVPVILVVFGSIDFIRAIVSTKEDEIKKGQQTFIKRLFTAAIIFFIFSIIKLVVSLVNGDSDRGINNVMNCTKCLINNDKNCIR